MPHPWYAGALSDDAVWRLSVCLSDCLYVCLTSVAYIRPNSRTERPRKTKIGTEVAHPTSHVTRTPLSRSKGQRSRSPGRLTRRSVNASASCSGDLENILTLGTYCYVSVCKRGRLGGARHFGAHRRRKVVVVVAVVVVFFVTSSLSLHKSTLLTQE